ncbi:potassium channel family protein [Haloferacaceae archaeon DSL9]
MRVIVVGYGRVGARTARVLKEEGHDVTVVETNRLKVERARDRGFAVVEGSGADEAVLEEAGVESADSIGGLTGDIDVNHAACLIGRRYGCRTIMRISEDVSSAVYENYLEDADDVVYPERLGAAGAKTALLGGNLNAIADLTEELQLTVVTVPDDAPIIGTLVTDVELPMNARLYAHGRNREPMTIPMPGVEVEAGDHLALLLERDGVESVKTALFGAA